MQIPSFLPLAGDLPSAVPEATPAGVEAGPSESLSEAFERLLDQAFEKACAACPSPAPFSAPADTLGDAQTDTRIDNPDAAPLSSFLSVPTPSASLSPAAPESGDDPVRFPGELGRRKGEAILTENGGLPRTSLQAPLTTQKTEHTSGLSGPESQASLASLTLASTAPASSASPAYASPAYAAYASPVLAEPDVPAQTLPDITRPDAAHDREDAAPFRAPPDSSSEPNFRTPRGDLAATVASSEQTVQALHDAKGKDPSDASREASQAGSSLPTEALAPRQGPVEKWAAAIQERGRPADQISDAALSHRALVERVGKAEIHLRLDPPELGRVRVHLSGDSHHLTGRIVVAEQATQVILETQVQAIRLRLEEAGITVAKFEVAWQGSEQSGGAWQEPRQPFDLPYFQTVRPGRAPGASVVARGPRGAVDVLA